MKKTTDRKGDETYDDSRLNNIKALQEKRYSFLVTEEIIAAHDCLLIPIIKNSRIGFIDHQGNVVIRPKYISINGKFTNKDSIVSANLHDRWEALDYKGNSLLSLQNLQDLGAFTDGCAIVRTKRNFWGYINIEGVPVIPFGKYTWYSNFENELSRVILSANNTNLWGIIDREGNEVLQPQYNRIDTLQNLNRVWIEDLKGRSYFVDLSKLKNKL